MAKFYLLDADIVERVLCLNFILIFSLANNSEEIEDIMFNFCRDTDIDYFTFMTAYRTVDGEMNFFALLNDLSLFDKNISDKSLCFLTAWISLECLSPDYFNELSETRKKDFEAILNKCPIIMNAYLSKPKVEHRKCLINLVFDLGYDPLVDSL